MKGLLAALCSPLSCALSLALYGRCEALCARAWAEDWRRWVAVMDRLMGPEPCGTAHCLASYVWWRCLSPAERRAARRARRRKWWRGGACLEPRNALPRNPGATAGRISPCHPLRPQ